MRFMARFAACLAGFPLLLYLPDPGPLPGKIGARLCNEIDGFSGAGNGIDIGDAGLGADPYLVRNFQDTSLAVL